MQITDTPTSHKPVLMKNQSLLFLAAVLILILFAIIVTQRMRERYPAMQVTATQADRGTGCFFIERVG